MTFFGQDRRRRVQPIRFILRLYPGQDDDLIRWLDELDGEQIGAKTRAMKETLRSGRHIGKAEAARDTSATPPLDLVEVRQVVEAAVDSALGRLDGQLVRIGSADPVEEGDEVEDLLDTFEDSLVLSEGE